MSPISDFIRNFNSNIMHGEARDILDLNMPDDITGWGVTENDYFNNTNDLHQRLKLTYSNRMHSDVLLEPLDSFTNKETAFIACRYKRDILFENGLHLKDDDLRFSIYLVMHNGRLKIRHGHLSKPWYDIQHFLNL